MGLASVNRLSIKCTPEKFQELIEDENIIPAPYYARNNWVCIQDGCRMKLNELKELIHDSYELVCSKLPVKIRKELVKDSKE
jgi:predicted DNA-binding protein (MmcQ/YjbR family)